MPDTLDLRQINRADRKAVLFAMLKRLRPGEVLIVVSNYELKGLYPSFSRLGYAYEARCEDFKWITTLSRRG